MCVWNDKKRGIDDEENIIRYISAKDASNKTGIDNSSILKSCKSANKKAGKFKWWFISDS